LISFVSESIESFSKSCKDNSVSESYFSVLSAFKSTSLTYFSVLKTLAVNMSYDFFAFSYSSLS